MAIGRTEDRDTPRNPMALRRHGHVQDPIRETHLGQRSSDRTTKAGHMTATDQTILTADTWQSGGRPHMGSGSPLRFGRNDVALRHER